MSADECFIRRDVVELLAAGVRRLTKLTKGISDAELERWYRIVSRFERNSLETRQQFARPDVLTYLAAVMLLPAEVKSTGAARAGFRKGKLDRIKQ